MGVECMGASRRSCTVEGRAPSLQGGVASLVRCVNVFLVLCKRLGRWTMTFWGQDGRTVLLESSTAAVLFGLRGSLPPLHSENDTCGD